MLLTKRQMADTHGATAEARGELVSSEIYDELEDEIVQKTMRR